MAPEQHQNPSHCSHRGSPELLCSLPTARKGRNVNTGEFDGWPTMQKNSLGGRRSPAPKPSGNGNSAKHKSKTSKKNSQPKQQPKEKVVKFQKKLGKAGHKQRSPKASNLKEKPRYSTQQGERKEQSKSVQRSDRDGPSKGKQRKYENKNKTNQK